MYVRAILIRRLLGLVALRRLGGAVFPFVLCLHTQYWIIRWDGAVSQEVCGLALHVGYPCADASVCVNAFA